MIKRQMAIALLLGTFFQTYVCSAQTGPVVKLTDSTDVEFAAVSTGKQFLTKVDSFVRLMQPLERQIRLESDKPVTQAQYIAFLGSNVRSWKEEEIAAVTEVLNELRAKFVDYQLPLPERIHLVRVSAKTEGNAPHCRGPAIIIPDRFMADRSKMTTVMAHELFHVLSSHNDQLRDTLYGTIDFQPCGVVELPAQLLPRRLTNPDAPLHRHAIELVYKNDKQYFVPITFTNRLEYSGGGLFSYIDFRLMQVQHDGDRWLPVLNEEAPVLVTPDEVPDFLRKIGRNTSYIIHPEETLADNFSMMVLGKEVKDAWVIEKMKEVLAEGNR